MIAIITFFTVTQALSSCVSERKPPPPLIRTSSGESPGTSRDGPEDASERRNKGGAKGSKRTKYKTEEERVAK